MSRFKTFLRVKVSRHIRITIVEGILLLFPVVITYLLISALFNFADVVLKDAIADLFGISIPGLGLVTLLVLVYLLGLLWTTAVGKRLVRLGQQYLLNLPVVGAVYSPARQLIESFSGSGESGFKRVVLIKYPRVGTWMVGFLTATTTVDSGQQMGVVYLPTAPTPNSGWVAILPSEDIYDTDLSVQEAMTMILSGGIGSPAELTKTALGEQSRPRAIAPE